MSELTEYFFEGAKVRTAFCGNAPLFVAKDVCQVVGISKYRDAVASLDEDERVSSKVDTPGGRQRLQCVTESGLYHLVFKSRKAAARKFRRWVTEEVIPALREKGFYSALKGRDFMTLPAWLVEQGVDLQRNQLEAKRLLRRAWESSKLLGYERRRVDDESGLVMFPGAVLELAGEGELAKLAGEAGGGGLVRVVLEGMEVGREYGVAEIAELGGFSGSVPRVRAEVGALMKRVVGMSWCGAEVESVKKARRSFWRLGVRS